jgi:hypothetical protein
MAVVSSDAPPTGVSFTRTISMFPDDAYFRLGFADAAVACEQSDHFGDNACHWDWNSTVAATLSVVLDEAIEQEDYMEGNVKVRRSKRESATELAYRRRRWRRSPVCPVDAHDDIYIIFFSG